MRVISLPSQSLNEAAIKCDRQFGNPHTSGIHGIQTAEHDVEMMKTELMKNEVTRQVIGLKLPGDKSHYPPFGTAMDKAFTRKWIMNYLKKTEDILAFEADESWAENN